MTNETKPMIFQAMNNAMRDIKHVGKNQQNKQQGFSFRGIDDMYNAVHGAMANHGVFCTPEVIERTETEKAAKSGAKATCVILRIKYTFYAIDGSSVSSVVEGEASDYGDKATSKALSMADKYNLIQVFKVPTSDIADADKESFELSKPENPRITAEEIEHIKTCITEYSINEGAFIGWLRKNRCNSIEDISTAFYLDVIAQIEKAKERK